MGTKKARGFGQNKVEGINNNRDRILLGNLGHSHATIEEN